jgi:hypothetical protein
MAMWKRLPQLKRVKKPVFILSTGRSGTTILGIVMSMHRDIGFLNEPKALWHSVYPLEDFIGNYSRGCAYVRLNETNVSAEVRSAAHRLLGAYLRVAGARRVLDKADWVFRVPFLRAIFPDAKFVFLVRNGWDTCRSVDAWSKNKTVRLNGETHDWWGADDRKWHLLYDQVIAEDARFAHTGNRLRSCRRHSDRAVMEWVVTMAKGLELAQVMPNSLFTLKFEHLMANPTNVLKELVEFCELPPDPKLIEYGSRVLTPLPPRERFEVDEAIRAPFEETLRAFGYS